MAKLLRFSDFDRWLSRQNRKITVEVEFCAPGLMPRMLELLDASPNRGQYILFSGNRSIIDDMQKTCRTLGKPAGIRLGANIRELTEENKAYISGLDLFEVGLNDRKYTGDDVDYLNDRGIQVFSNLGDLMILNTALKFDRNSGIIIPKNSPNKRMPYRNFSYLRQNGDKYD